LIKCADGFVGQFIELASRGHRGQADRRAGRQDPAPYHQPATAPSEIANGLDRLSGLVDRSRGFQTISVVAPQRSRLARPISLGNRPAMSRDSSAGKVRLALALSQGCQLSLFQDIPRLIDGLRTRPAPA
jgi:hypothetical protein